MAKNIFDTIYKNYVINTPKSLQLIDLYLAYVIYSGVVQMLYMIIAGSFPYNAFLSGFIGSVGTFVLVGNSPISYI
jgi:oligosaccharyltransferase complex subunit epsilon